MTLFKISLLILIISLSSCSAKKALEASSAGERINRAEQNTDHLFKDLE